jgi:hypothetical protein
MKGIIGFLIIWFIVLPILGWIFWAFVLVAFLAVHH